MTRERRALVAMALFEAGKRHPIVRQGGNHWHLADAVLRALDGVGSGDLAR